MIIRYERTKFVRLSKAACCAFFGMLVSATCLAQDAPVETAASNAVAESCSVDLTLAGTMSDILSNALMHEFKKQEKDVVAFLEKAKLDAADGQELLNEVAGKFAISPEMLATAVEKFRHCNCNHGQVAEGAKIQNANAPKVSKFAQDVIVHVVLHELAHGLVREFDLPILGNEETMADAFATVYLTSYMPDRAVDVLRARTRSLMIEAKEVPGGEWTVAGEHNNDARRAYQIAALAIAADHEKYLPIAMEVGMTEDNIRQCLDYGTEIHRSWRRILEPLWMQQGLDSREVRFRYDADSSIVSQLKASGVTKEIESVVKRFDWHSQVTIHFAEADGGAGWSRSKRTVTVNSEYVRRFIKQGRVD